MNRNNCEKNLPTTNMGFQLTSTAQCASQTNVISNSITMNVMSSVTPTISISVSTNNICQGTSVTYTSTITNGGTPTYQWKVNGINVGINTNSYSYTPNNADIVTCQLTSTAQCASPTNVISNSITMNVTTIPLAPIITNMNTFLNSNYSNGQVQWYNAITGILNGETNQLLVPTTCGQFYCIEIINGCSSSPSDTINFIPLGINNLTLNNEISIFPNPSIDGIYSIRNSGNLNITRVTIYTVEGRVIRELKYCDKIDISNFSKGIYLLKVKTEKNNIVKKLIYE